MTQKARALELAQAKYPGREIVVSVAYGSRGARVCSIYIRVPEMFGVSVIAARGASWDAAIADLEQRLRLRLPSQNPPELHHCQSCNCGVGPDHDCNWLGIEREYQSLP